MNISRAREGPNVKSTRAIVPYNCNFAVFTCLKQKVSLQFAQRLRKQCSGVLVNSYFQNCYARYKKVKIFIICNTQNANIYNVSQRDRVMRFLCAGAQRVPVPVRQVRGVLQEQEGIRRPCCESTHPQASGAGREAED